MCSSDLTEYLARRGEEIELVSRSDVEYKFATPQGFNTAIDMPQEVMENILPRFFVPPSPRAKPKRVNKHGNQRGIKGFLPESYDPKRKAGIAPPRTTAAGGKVLYCEACDRTMNTPSQFSEHITGRTHKRFAALAEAKTGRKGEVVDTGFVPTFRGRKPRKYNSFFLTGPPVDKRTIKTVPSKPQSTSKQWPQGRNECNLCEYSGSDPRGLANHMKGLPHRMNAEIVKVTTGNDPVNKLKTKSNNPNVTYIDTVDFPEADEDESPPTPEGRPGPPATPRPPRWNNPPLVKSSENYYSDYSSIIVIIRILL